MWIERNYAVTLQRYLKIFPSVLLTGARQVGKSSLLKHLYPQVSYFSFDDQSLANRAESNPAEFISSLPKPVILDEVQYVRGIFQPLKQFIDQAPKPGQFLLTGSQVFPLMENVSESMAGRCGVMKMLTLSAQELSVSEMYHGLEDLFIRGGYPKIHGETIKKPQDWYASYVNTYLERDVRNIQNVGSLRDFDRYLRATAYRSGQILSYADLAKDVGIAPNTARSWLSVLEASGQVILLEPYYRNLTKRLVKSPKLLFWDSGLVCFLMGINNWEDLMRSPIAGNLWESFVITQILKLYIERGESPPFWFWRTSNGDEVDLVIEKGGRFILIEIKLTEKPDESDLKGMVQFEKEYGADSVISKYLLCRVTHTYQIKNTNTMTTNLMDLLKVI